MIGSRLDIAENQDEIAAAFEGVSEDLGYKVKVIYTDPSNSPQLIGVDKNGNKYIKDGTAYVDKDTGIGYILINTKSPANKTKAGVIGTIAEEQSHVIGKFEGRQKIVPDESEKGLESLGRPTNNYFKNQYSKNDKTIGLKSDRKDYSNVNFGENVGDDIYDDMQYEQSLPVATTLNRGAKIIRPDIQKEIEKDGYTKVIEKYGKIPYEDSIHKKYGDKHKEEVKVKQIEAEEKTKKSKTEIFYVRIDGINEEITVESVPKAGSFWWTIGDTLGGLLKNSGEYQSYDYDTRLSKEEKEIKKAIKGKELSKSISDTLGGLGISRYITEHITQSNPGRIEYGMKKEVEERFELNYEGTQQVVELLGAAAISKVKTFVGNKIKEGSKAKNIVTAVDDIDDKLVKKIENVGDTAKTVRKNGQQAQKVQNSVVQNNKNSINKPLVDVSELNNQQSKQIYTNKISQEIYLSKPKQNGVLVIGAGNNPIKGAYNIDIKDSISSAVYYGDATNLVNIQTGSQAKVIIENPNGFDPLNPEILRVIKKGGELEISGVVKNPDFSKMYVDKAKTIVKVPDGFELIEAGEIPENLRKQGYRKNGTPIGQQKNGVGVPKKTDRIIRLRKIGE